MTSQSPTTALVSWTVPGSSFTVTYSLPVLQEIEFAVNEGYRRIPHGGVEVGGLLFGRAEENSTSIQAFRLIECEHARGPSFVLSERDLTALWQQLTAASSDPELQELRPIGWFIAHTRGQLQMTDLEYGLFAQLFPAPGGITLLAKPERFKPTRFAFLVRDSRGQIERDGTRHAIILPSPSRPARSPETPPVPRVEPPQPPAVAQQPITEEPQEQLALALDPTPSRIEEPKVPKASPPSTAGSEPVPAVAPNVIPPQVIPPRKPEPIHTSAAEPAVSLEAKPIPASRPEPAAPPPAPVIPHPPTPALPVAAATALPSMEEIRRRRWENLRGTSVVGPEPAAPSPGAPPPHQLMDALTAHQEITRKMREQSNRSKLLWTATLLLAAGLGSVVGYWAYLQLRSASIPLTLHVASAGLLVSWPPEQTRDAVYAAIQIDDAAAIPLSVEEKTAGQAAIQAAGDNLKIELIVQHWMRNSEGIIRYVKASTPPPPPPPPVSAKKRPRKED